MFTYILAELPEGRARRIRTTGNRVIIGGIRLATAHTQLGKRNRAYPVIIPMPPVIFGQYTTVSH